MVAQQCEQSERKIDMPHIQCSGADNDTHTHTYASIHLRKCIFGLTTIDFYIVDLYLCICAFSITFLGKIGKESVKTQPKLNVIIPIYWLYGVTFIKVTHIQIYTNVRLIRV